MIITSLENEKIKKCFKLREKKYRDLYNEFLVEGEHLVIEAYRSNLLEEILILEDEVTMLDKPITYISKEIVDNLSTLEAPSHIFGICKKREESNELGKRILMLDRIQDPGNLGTIIRSSKAFNIDTLILGEGCCDLYNEKVIRATQGNGFHMNIISRNLIEVIKELKEKEIPILGTKVEYGEDIRNLTTRDKECFALIMGNEGRGVSSEILDLCDKFIYIEMSNQVEIRILSDFEFKDKVFVPNMVIYIGRKKEKEIIKTYRHHKNFEMITMEGYSDINEVLRYKGLYVYIKKEDLKLNDDEYLDDDLIDLNVYVDNENKGIITDIRDGGNNKFLVIKTNDKEVFVPLNKEFIKSVDLKNKKIIIKPIKGMF